MWIGVQQDLHGFLGMKRAWSDPKPASVIWLASALVILLAAVLVPAGNFAFLSLLFLLVRIFTWGRMSLSRLVRRTFGLASLRRVC